MHSGTERINTSLGLVGKPTGKAAAELDGGLHDNIVLLEASSCVSECHGSTWLTCGRGIAGCAVLPSGLRPTDAEAALHTVYRPVKPLFGHYRQFTQR